MQIEYTNTTSGDTIRNTIVGSKQRATNATNGTTIIEIFLKDDNKSVGNRVNVGDTFDLPSPPSSSSPIVLPSFFDRPRKYIFIPGNNLLGTHLDSYIITNDSQETSASILQYDNKNNIAYLEGDISLWELGDNYSLRSEIPIFYGEIESNPTTEIDYVNTQNQFLLNTEEISDSVIFNYGRFSSVSGWTESEYFQIEHVYLLIEIKSGSLIIGDILESISGKLKVVSSISKPLTTTISGSVYKADLVEGDFFEKSKEYVFVNERTDSDVKIENSIYIC